jgi:hypothetical protein
VSSSVAILYALPDVDPDTAVPVAALVTVNCVVFAEATITFVKLNAFVDNP